MFEIPAGSHDFVRCHVITNHTGGRNVRNVQGEITHVILRKEEPNLCPKAYIQYLSMLKPIPFSKSDFILIAKFIFDC